MEYSKIKNKPVVDKIMTIKAKNKVTATTMDRTDADKVLTTRAISRTMSTDSDSGADPFARRGSVRRSPPGTPGSPFMTLPEGNLVRPDGPDNEIDIRDDIPIGVGELRQRGELDADSDRQELKNIKEIGLKLRKFVLADSNKVSKNACEHILNCVGEYEEVLMRVLFENERLKGRLLEIEKQGRLEMCAAAPISYADAAKTAKSTANAASSKPDELAAVRQTVPRSYAVVVRPSDKNVNMSSEKVKETVLSKVSKNLELRVKAIRKVRNGGIAIETVSEKEREKIIRCEKFAEHGLDVRLPKRVGPKIIIFDVPNELTEDNVRKELFEKNLRGQVTQEELIESSRIVGRHAKKGAVLGNIILETAPQISAALRQKGRIFLGWGCHRVKEYLAPLRCYRCYGFGHLMKECNLKEKACRRCGQLDHLQTTCKKEIECRNCKVKGKVCDHSVLSSECPEYIRAVGRERLRLENG